MREGLGTVALLEVSRYEEWALMFQKPVPFIPVLPSCLASYLSIRVDALSHYSSTRPACLLLYSAKVVMYSPSGTVSLQ